jgi:hypothetical protein
VFVIVAEGFDMLTKINEAYVDNNGRYSRTSGSVLPRLQNKHQKLILL